MIKDSEPTRSTEKSEIISKVEKPGMPPGGGATVAR
jgi:hypothetical protein